jgi:hypothetical protein
LAFERLVGDSLIVVVEAKEYDSEFEEVIEHALDLDLDLLQEERADDLRVGLQQSIVE